MKHTLKIFFLFSKNSIKTVVGHPIGMVLLLLGKVLRFALLISFIYFLVGRTKTIAGYSLNQTMVFFLTFAVIDNASQIFFREVYRFRPLVISGELDTILVKPYHPFLRILIGGVDMLDAILMLPYLFILLYFIFQNSSAVTSMSIVFYIALAINGFVIATAFHIMVLALGILTSEVDHTIMIYRDLTRVATVPIDVYREPVRFIFSFVLPVGVMMSFPAKALYNALSVPVIGISFCIGGLSLWGALQLWSYALQVYQSASS